MRLIDISIRNFMRFRRARLKLHDAGMTLIEGKNLDDESASSNGAGKSSIVDALVWCLYGMTTHDSCEGDDVVNEKRGANCEVKVRFADDDSEIYWEVTRRRAWRKGGKKVQLNLVQVGRDYERKLTKGTIRDTQTEIVRTLGMSVATFRHACIFGHGRAYRFSRLTDSDKKAVLDEMLGSEIYAKASQKAGDQLATVERQIDKLQTQRETQLESLQDAKHRMVRLGARARDAARLAKRTRKALKREVAALKAKLVSELPDVAKAREAWHTARDAARVAQDARSAAQHAVTQTAAQEQEFTREHSRFAKLEATECVTCKQQIDASHVARQLQAIDLRLLQAGAAVDQAKSQFKWCKLEADKAKSTADALFERYEDAKRRQADRERIESKLESVRARLAEVRVSDYDALVADERKQCTKIKKRIRAVKRDIATQEHDAEQLRFWQHGFGAKGLRSLLLDSALPYLNARLEVYTNALTAGNIAVEFRTQRELKGGGTREDFYVHVENRHGSTKYSMNSVGERAKIDIVVGLALQDMAASRSRAPINVAFFDEVFDGLDERGVDRAVQVLSQLKRESAFVITHNDGLKAFFTRQICVVKKNGESRLEAT